MKRIFFSFLFLFVYFYLFATNNGGIGYNSHSDNSQNATVQEQEESNSLYDSSMSIYKRKGGGSIGTPTNDSGSTGFFQDSNNSGDSGIFRAPPGSGGDPIGGVTPVGSGFYILLWLSFAYTSFILVIKSKNRGKKMGKTMMVFFIFLGISIFQTYGQAPPAGAKRIFIEDFGGNDPSFPTVATKAYADSILPPTSNSPQYANAQRLINGTDGPTGNGDNSYCLAKSTSGAAFAAWWGSTATSVEANGKNKFFDDHTYPNDVTRGYMMIINAAAQPMQFFKYTINGLCPNTKLYFSVWAGNLVRSTFNDAANRSDPLLRFEINDENGALLAQSNDTIIPKTAGPDWHQYGFNFTTGSSESITLYIYDNQTNATGNDLVLDDIEISLLAPQVAVAGRLYYCDGEKLKLNVNYDPDEISATYGSNAKVQWLYTSDLDPNKNPEDNDFTGWSTVTMGTDEAKEGYYVAVIGTEGSIADGIADGDYLCCSVSDTVKVSFIPLYKTLYWHPQAGSQDWNDPKNWLLDGTTVVPYAPSVCTDVHIPGNSASYPSLYSDTFGDPPACQNIWFHYGGMIGQPQILNYNNAYVQYNFGKSGGVNGDPSYSATPASRGQWYMMAAPLQKMVSGDFSFGGYPNMWQQSFRTSPQSNGVAYGDWYPPDNTNSWDIGKQYNAIAIWAGEYTDPLLDGDPSSYGEGPAYQENLDGLNGILEIPYFNNAGAYHREFFQSNDTSYFRYYYDDLPGLDFVDTIAPSFIVRAAEANRFIFEADGHPFSKESVGVYTMDINSSADEIMVGNPFMSNLDFDAFATDNPGIGEYILYSGNNFTAYSYEAGGGGTANRYIAPLQSFIIKPGGVGKLKFDANTEAVVTDPNSKLRSSSTDNSNYKDDVLYLKAESKSGVSWLTLSMQNVKEKNLNLLLPSGYPNVPQLFATDDAGQRNSIQFEGGYVCSVPLGIISSDNTNQVTLTVYNKDKLNINGLTLWDKYLDEKIDLKTTDSYTFTNVSTEEDRFVLMIEKSATGIPSVEEDAHSIYVGASGNTLYISASSEIEDVSVITLQGITVLKESNIGQTSYSKSLQVPSGLYIISVKLKTGERNIAKTILK